MPATTSHGLDLDALRRAVEERDAAAQASNYAEDAVVESVDHEHPPSRPLTLRGREQIAAHLADVCARDMTHRVIGAVGDDEHAAYQVACEYPDGTRVLCSTLVELRDGRIVRERWVQAWDS
ncbi:MAG: nuclear transport factor 2 family protein [Solirubrobacterales bacterium]|jgi:ketosteroid isomerase-like protein|nr:nuclear transport factor 2 family protein [Solirubrobacterales bacterium]